MMTNRTARFTAIMIALITLFTLMIPFSNRTYAADFKVSGSTKASVTFIVKTGDKVRGGNYVELETSKGVLNCSNKFMNWDSPSKNYGFYYVYVTNLDTGSYWWTSMYKKDIRPVDKDKVSHLRGRLHSSGSDDGLLHE